MERGFYLITGTSRGIGEALARTLLEQGNTVLGVARHRSDQLSSPAYHHLSLDLSQVSDLPLFIQRAKELFDSDGYDFLCLVHNASLLEPIGPIEGCDVSAIDAHVRVGLIAPMGLSSLFIREFAGSGVRKKIAFVSSGAAFRAMADMSVYCSSKAGLAMLAQCISLEQTGKNAGVEIVSISPGMVETSMQQAMRKKPEDEFAQAAYFRQAAAERRVQPVEEVIDRIVTILRGTYEQAAFVRCSDV